MAREISIGKMVSLPRLNGSSALALAEQLLTMAESRKGEGLPTFIERPRARLETAKSALKEQLKPQEEADSSAKTAADRAVDDAWRSLSGWTGAMAGMPDGSFEGQDRIRALHAMLFGEGLSFIALSFREEWTQSETRLKAIADSGYEGLIEGLGGAPFLKNLKDAHNRYGEALGIKAPVAAEEAPEVRENLDRLTSRMKEYVVKVAAWADPEEPGSPALTDALLTPLVQWKDTPSRQSAPADAGTPVSE
jgi:hypothetical protein